MFTWNLQFVSKKHLGDTLSQLGISDEESGDVLVRIHTAVHTPEEAVDLAAFIRGLIPRAHILGTSTSAVISGGKLAPDQCVISVTQMDEGHVSTVRIPVEDGAGRMVPAEELCAGVAERLEGKGAKLLLAFFPEPYRDTERFVYLSNSLMPDVQMIGGVTDWNDIIGDAGFVFDEAGWSGRELILAALGGKDLECLCDFAAGVQMAGDLHEITKASGDHITEVDGIPAARFIHEGIGEEICEKTKIGFYFPLAYDFDGIEVPFVIGYYGDDGIGANHNVTVGRKVRRGFFYDRKIISDNRAMFNRMESFEKGETFFAYGCMDRFRYYPNSVLWELSAYENSNMCGCLTQGEITTVRGRKVFPNCSFVLAAAGENPESQQLNPYVFSHTGTLAEDNQTLISFLADAAQSRVRGGDQAMNESLKSFIGSCERMLLFAEKSKIANEAAMSMDISLRGYDRVCLIDVPDVTGMRLIFPEQLIEKTHNHYILECAAFAAQKNYRVYRLSGWQMAVAVPSYEVSLRDFTEDMRLLQKRLFAATEEYIAAVSSFCVINECRTENIKAVYDAARLEMNRKNIQFLVCDGKEKALDEESLREKYRMVRVINHALAHDGVVPYYQGIYDNRRKAIHHYEALMRLKDEEGRLCPPAAFLDVARSYGLLYDALSMAMIRKVFERFRDSADKSVSINLGIRDIKNEEMTSYIYSFLSITRYPEHFAFEILENEDVDEYETLRRFVDSIHRLGAKISIDDFGNGYSNLMHMISIPADYLKIDGSIIRECCRKKESENMVEMIAAWGKMIGRSEIVAEYVENEQIQEMLLRYGIEYSQGYLFSKPSPEIPED